MLRTRVFQSFGNGVFTTQNRPFNSSKVFNRILYFRRPSSTGMTPESTQSSRFQKLNSRLPRWLQKYTSALANAPFSHVSAFLVLHEITAVVPLLSLAAAFHYTNWLPPFISEWKWASEGMQKFGNYFRKKGWLGREIEVGEKPEWKQRWWNRSEKGTRIVVEFATAYAITKALIPLRVALSLWATPWFARVFVIKFTSRIKGLFTRLTGSKSGMIKSSSPPVSGSPPSAAAGTGAVGGRVIPTQAPGKGH